MPDGSYIQVRSGQLLVVEYVEDQPTTVEAASAAVQSARNCALRRAFPVLTVVRAQPDARWGLFLASALWDARRTFVCFDVYGWQQRLFALPVPRVVSGSFLAEAAGLTPTEFPDIFVDGHGPVQLTEEVVLHSGSCVCALPGVESCRHARVLPLVGQASGISDV